MKKYYIALLLMLTLGIMHSSCKKNADSPQERPPEWQMDTTGKYPFTMTAVVTLPHQLNMHLDNGDQMGAFIDGTCRGIGALQRVGETPVFFVLIHGEADEQQPIVFRYYSTSNATLYYSYNDLQFSVDSNFGLVDDPEVLKLRKP